MNGKNVHKNNNEGKKTTKKNDMKVPKSSQESIDSLELMFDLGTKKETSQKRSFLTMKLN